VVRLIRRMPTRGDFALSVSRQSGRREIICAFGDKSDAALLAKVTDASVSDNARHSFILDEPAELKLLKLAGSGERYRPRKGTAPGKAEA
jgi:hypothetical protein